MKASRMMIKKKILVNGEIDVSFERDEEGRWIIGRIKNRLSRDERPETDERNSNEVI